MTIVLLAGLGAVNLAVLACTLRALWMLRTLDREVTFVKKEILVAAQIGPAAMLDAVDRIDRSIRRA